VLRSSNCVGVWKAVRAVRVSSVPIVAGVRVRVRVRRLVRFPRLPPPIVSPNRTCTRRGFCRPFPPGRPDVPISGIR